VQVSSTIDDWTLTVKVAEIDEVLHAERAIAGGGKHTFEANVAELPRGTMFAYEGNAYLVWT